MDKNFAINTVVSAVVLIVLGFVKGAVGVGGDMAFTLDNILGWLFMGAFFTLVLGGWKGVGNAMDGFKAGALLGALLSFGSAPPTSGDAVVDAVVALVAVGVVGAVLGVMAGRFSG